MAIIMIKKSTHLKLITTIYVYVHNSFQNKAKSDRTKEINR